MADHASALLVDANLKEAMSFYAGANPEGRIDNLSGVLAVFCGRNYPVFNVALLGALPSGNLRNEISRTLAHYKSLHSGFSFWLCHDLVAPELLNEVRATSFPLNGFIKLSEPPGMLLSGSPMPPKRTSPPLTFKRVEDPATRTAFSHLTSVIFDIPFGIANNMYGSASGWTEEYEGWLAMENDQPIALALLVYTSSSAGLYSIGVLPHLRRFGYGEQVIRFAINRAKTAKGLNRFVLQSSDAGFHLYKRLGFEQVTRFSVYKSRET